MIPPTFENYRLIAQYYYHLKRDIYFECHHNFSYNDVHHILDVAASVMMSRDGIMIGGGFVEAITHNDLMGAFDRADAVMVKSIRFMVYIYRNGILRSDSPIFEKVETKPLL